MTEQKRRFTSFYIVLTALNTKAFQNAVVIINTYERYNMITTLKTLFAVTCMTLATTGVAIADQDEAGAPSKHCPKAQHTSERHMGMHTWDKPPYLYGIALSAEQKDKIFALNHAEVPKIRDHMKQRKAIHQALRQLSQAPQFDESKARALAENLANVEKEGLLTRAKTESKVLALLTSEQRAQALNNIEHFTQPHGNHHQHPHERS